MGVLPDAQTKARDTFQGKFYAVGWECAHPFAQLVTPSFSVDFHPPRMRRERWAGRLEAWGTGIRNQDLPDPLRGSQRLWGNEIIYRVMSNSHGWWKIEAVEESRGQRQPQKTLLFLEPSKKILFRPQQNLQHASQQELLEHRIVLNIKY